MPAELASIEARVQQLEWLVRRPITNPMVAGGAGIQPSKIGPSLDSSDLILLSGNQHLQDDMNDIVAFLNVITPGSAGAPIYSNGTKWLAASAGTATQVLKSGGAGAPVWSGVTIDASNNMSIPGTLDVVGNTQLGDSSADQLVVNATIQSNLIFGDGLYDIGASGATRPRNLYLTGTIITTNATDATSINTGSIITDGGVGIEKALWVGGLANIAGAVTLQSTLTVSGTGIYAGNGSVGAPSYSFTGDTDTGIYHTTSGANRILIGVDNTEVLRLGAGFAQVTGDYFGSGALNTGAPTGGAGAWKLGIANAVSPTSPNRTITVDIGGTLYYLHAKTTND